MIVTEVILGDFIEQKANQLTQFLQAFYASSIPFKELELFLWDTLEEWHQLKVSPNFPISHKEQVFWHLVQQVSFWSEDNLKNELYLHSEIQACMDFLQNKACLPIDCIGVRP